MTDHLTTGGLPYRCNSAPGALLEHHRAGTDGRPVAALMDLSGGGSDGKSSSKLRGLAVYAAAGVAVHVVGAPSAPVTVGCYVAVVAVMMAAATYVLRGVVAKIDPAAADSEYAAAAAAVRAAHPEAAGNLAALDQWRARAGRTALVFLAPCTHTDPPEVCRCPRTRQAVCRNAGVLRTGGALVVTVGEHWLTDADPLFLRFVLQHEAAHTRRWRVPPWLPALLWPGGLLPALAVTPFGWWWLAAAAALRVAAGVAAWSEEFAADRIAARVAGRVAGVGLWRAAASQRPAKRRSWRSRGYHALWQVLFADHPPHRLRAAAIAATVRK